MRSRESRDKKWIHTEKDALYYAAGIPQRFWNAKTESCSYAAIARSGEVYATIQDQEKWVQTVSDPAEWRKNYFTAIGSEPTDTESLALLFTLAKKMAEAQCRIMVQDMGMLDEAESDPSIVYLGYNILGDVDPIRARRIRDWLTEHEASFCMIAVAGDAFDFTMGGIRKEADMCIALKGAKTVRRSRG